MSDIFISYAHEDQAFVRRMVPALEREGFSVWWDHTIPPGKTWDTSIAKGISEARCCIVVWSSNSIGSDWVKEEATLAKDASKLLPVQIDADPPMGFRRIQAANLRNWSGDTHDAQWQMLVREARSMVGGASAGGAPSAAAPPSHAPRPSYAPPASARRSNTPAIAITAIAALVAAAAAFVIFTRQPAEPDVAAEPPAAVETVAAPADTTAADDQVEFERLRQAELDRLRRQNVDLETARRQALEYAQRIEAQQQADRLAEEQRRRAEEQQRLASARSMIGDWDGDWSGWIGVWTFYSDGTFSHGFGPGVEEECRHGVYTLTGSQLWMQYGACNASTVNGTLNGAGTSVTATASDGASITFTRQ